MHRVTPFLRQANNLLVFYFDESQSYQTVLGALECIARRGGSYGFRQLWRDDLDENAISS